MARFKERAKNTVDAVQLACPVQLHNGAGIEQASPGDWFVTYPDGSQSLLTDSEFQATYEPMKAPGRKPKNSEPNEPTEEDTDSEE